MVITHALEWPTLTMQWFPDKEVYVPRSRRFADKGFARHRLLMGTHTSGQDQNYVQIATANLPLTDAEADAKLEVKDYDEEKGGTCACSRCRNRLLLLDHAAHPDHAAD